MNEHFPLLQIKLSIQFPSPHSNISPSLLPSPTTVLCHSSFHFLPSTFSSFPWSICPFLSASLNSTLFLSFPNNWSSTPIIARRFNQMVTETRKEFMNRIETRFLHFLPSIFSFPTHIFCLLSHSPTFSFLQKCLNHLMVEPSSSSVKVPPFSTLLCPACFLSFSLPLSSLPIESRSVQQLLITFHTLSMYWFDDVVTAEAEKGRDGQEFCASLRRNSFRYEVLGEWWQHWYRHCPSLLFPAFDERLLFLASLPLSSISCHYRYQGQNGPRYCPGIIQVRGMEAIVAVIVMLLLLWQKDEWSERSWEWKRNQSMLSWIFMFWSWKCGKLLILSGVRGKHGVQHHNFFKLPERTEALIKQWNPASLVPRSIHPFSLLCRKEWDPQNALTLNQWKHFKPLVFASSAATSVFLTGHDEVVRGRYKEPNMDHKGERRKW